MFDHDDFDVTSDAEKVQHELSHIRTQLENTSRLLKWIYNMSWVIGIILVAILFKLP